MSASLVYPSALQPYAVYITLLLGFLDGLLFGLAIKKALISVVLIVVAFIIASVLGLSFIPSVSTSQISSTLFTFFSHLNFGTIGVTFSIVLFVIGFGIGIWKG